MFDQEMGIDELEIALAMCRAHVEKLTAKCDRYQHELMKRSADAEGQEQAVIYDVLQQSFDWGK